MPTRGIKYTGRKRIKEPPPLPLSFGRESMKYKAESGLPPSIHIPGSTSMEDVRRFLDRFAPIFKALGGK